MKALVWSCFLLILQLSTAEEHAEPTECTEEKLNICLNHFDFTDDLSRHPLAFAGRDRDELCGDYNYYEGCVVSFKQFCPVHHIRRLDAVDHAVQQVCENVDGDRECACPIFNYLTHTMNVIQYYLYLAWEQDYECVHGIADLIEEKCTKPYHDDLDNHGATDGFFKDIEHSNAALYTDLCSLRLNYQRCAQDIATGNCDAIAGRLVYNFTGEMTRGNFDTSQCPGGHLLPIFNKPTTLSPVKTSALFGVSRKPTFKPSTDGEIRDNDLVGAPDGQPKKKNSVGIGLGIFAAIVIIVAAVVLLLAYRRSERLKRTSEGKNIINTDNKGFGVGYNA